jgi:hypothetical protein
VRHILSLSVLTLCFILPALALACRCTEPKSVDAAYQAARAVIVARVLEVQAAPHVDGFTAVLSVSQAWKKDVPNQLTIQSGTTCRYGLESNHEYLLYLTHDPKMLGGRDDKTYTTGICLGNKPLPEASKTVRWLQKHGRASAVRPAP